MDSVPTALGATTEYPWLKFLGFIFIAIGLYFLIKWIVRNIYERSTPKNIQMIRSKQYDILAARWSGLMSRRQGLGPAMMTIPQEQRLLINTSVFATRVGGYLGPYSSGVFAEDNAIQLALSAGSRCLVLEIDYVDNNYAPVLVYRDGWGLKQSLNTGDLNQIARSIAARAFTPANDSAPASVASDPLIVVLYFVRAPSQTNKPKDYIKFLAATAEKLAPLRDYLAGATPQGDFRRQALESQLFFQPFQVFNSRILLLTNADTSGFRRLEAYGLKGQYTGAQDLDFMVHCRLYSRESPTPFGISMAPGTSTRPAAVITTPGYWLMTPPDRQKDAYESNKQAWTLCMPPVATETSQPKAEDITRLIKSYGVHAVPLCLFDKKEITDRWTGEKAPFERSLWPIKEELLRYIPPKPIAIQKPYPESNSGGGAVISPTTGPSLSDQDQPAGGRDFKCPFESKLLKHNNVTICDFTKPVMLPPNIVEQLPQFKNTGINNCVNGDELKANNPELFKKIYQNEKGEYLISFCNILEDVVVRKKPYKVYWVR